jgi:hypothetical protein
LFFLSLKRINETGTRTAMGELGRSRSCTERRDYDDGAEYLPAIDRNTVHPKSPTQPPAIHCSPFPNCVGVYDSGHSFAGQVKHLRPRSKPPTCPSALSGHGACGEGLGRMTTMRGQRHSCHRDRFLVIHWMRHARFPARAGAESMIALRQQVSRAERRAEPRPLSRINIPVVSSSDTQLTRYARVVLSK